MLPHNESLLDYAPGSPERRAVSIELDRLAGERIDMPLIINGGEVRTGKVESAPVPHDHARTLGQAHLAGPSEIAAAIEAATRTWPSWSRSSLDERSRILLKAADMLAGPWRSKLNAAIMLGQSKTVHQAEIDTVELIDFWRFNVAYAERIHAEQPVSTPGTLNSADYRPLEGFVLAITPFNFAAIAGNLATAPALMGNTVVWKPSPSAKLAAHLIMAALTEAGLPDGVINLVFGDAEDIANAALSDPRLAGVHFTGSTAVFQSLLARAAHTRYRTFPRFVGETGGKNFIVAHPSADPAALATAIIRGGYEYQGQKCSAASRVFVPEPMWRDMKDDLIAQIEDIRAGDVADFRNFMGAVIHEAAWRRLSGALEQARNAPETSVLAGGGADMRQGYFVEPTLLETTDPHARFMTEELFGPIVTVLPYPQDRYEEVLGLIDETSAYGLTGAVFARDRQPIALALERLRHTAGNFYINDKPTGAVVGQQPFGGARQSGTNDKAGGAWNLLRWTSPRTIKETSLPPHDYRYPFMREDASAK